MSLDETYSRKQNQNNAYKFHAWCMICKVKSNFMNHTENILDVTMFIAMDNK